MMMTTIAAMILSMQAAPADEAVKRPEKLDDISIPRELSPALMPYISCRQSAQGIALYDDDGKLLNPRDTRQDCGPLREKAHGKTIGILKDLMLGRNRTERAELADAWLAYIDRLSGPTDERDS